MTHIIEQNYLEKLADLYFKSKQFSIEKQTQINQKIVDYFFDLSIKNFSLSEFFLNEFTYILQKKSLDNFSNINNNFYQTISSQEYINHQSISFSNFKFDLPIFDKYNSLTHNTIDFELLNEAFSQKNKQHLDINSNKINFNISKSFIVKKITENFLNNTINKLKKIPTFSHEWFNLVSTTSTLMSYYYHKFNINPTFILENYYSNDISSNKKDKNIEKIIIHLSCLTHPLFLEEKKAKKHYLFQSLEDNIITDLLHSVLPFVQKHYSYKIKSGFLFSSHFYQQNEDNIIKHKKDFFLNSNNPEYLNVIYFISSHFKEDLQTLSKDFGLNSKKHPNNNLSTDIYNYIVHVSTYNHIIKNISLPNIENKPQTVKI